MLKLNEWREIRNGYSPYKLGIIQARGVGDAIIAMPIAKYYYNLGHEIHFVIDQQYVEAMSYAFPYVTFHGVYDEEKNLLGNISNEYWYETPYKILKSVGCDKVMSFPYEETHLRKNIPPNLAKRLEGEFEQKGVQQNLTRHLSFDQYKYAIAGVSFGEKWNLDIRRNKVREYELFNKLVVKPNYVVTHTVVNNGAITIQIGDVEPFFRNTYGGDVQIINLDKITDNLFDWLTILENATAIMAMDSSYCNIIDQLGFNNPDKYFIQRSMVDFTPTLLTKWNHIKAFEQ